ncbi:MAG: hypothetical protein Q7R65_03000 [bacterium]|nr:hypothetical protein [bacterium]
MEYLLTIVMSFLCFLAGIFFIITGYRKNDKFGQGVGIGIAFTLFINLTQFSPIRGAILLSESLSAGDLRSDTPYKLVEQRKIEDVQYIFIRKSKATFDSKFGKVSIKPIGKLLTVAYTNTIPVDNGGFIIKAKGSSVFRPYEIHTN